ncbi:hypothetical protein DFJ58DRAFT_274352 [Suillus subalutaceus]|uniref:uncharacterized protein n=1 Tax=Suillus subalutaceus TaxID=48586 RepID=UPI001B860F9D|nr:uncharacterized protein DFJ58DRAFT_274352 [Suillus subalutaceus]KAG1860266.1 hypothetical protein DFJ58DRAFT_274352 [Suillus subalutaceus]
MFSFRSSTILMRIVQHLFFFLALLFAPVQATYLNVTVNNTDPSIQFSSGWNSCPDISPPDGLSYGGTRNCTSQYGTNATFTFTGVVVYYIAPHFTADGDVLTVLQLDSEPLVVVNLTQAQGQSLDWAIRWAASGLKNGTHTLVIYGPSNTMTPSSTWGEVNAFM